MKRFEQLHPLTQTVFFLILFVSVMQFFHPIYLIISLISGIFFGFVYKKKREVIVQTVGLFGLFLVAAIINPLFSHQGVTILGYFKDGNPFTLESVYYGIAAALMVVNLVIWCGVLMYVFTTDRLICLLGPVFPTISLVISMILRFVPRFQKRIQDTDLAIRGANGKLGQTTNGFYQFHLFYAVTGHALENTVDLADSMKARGYGMKRRRSYQMFRFEIIDMVLILAMTCCYIMWFYCKRSDIVSCMFYPMFVMKVDGMLAILSIVIYLIFVNLPLLLEVGDMIRWKCLKQKI